ncbi:thioredoxin reductase [Brevibacterium sanguinis]|uniref:Thioredoxin reductase n=2 Tax=Brevibacterium TaxID=1696 RepID=A0A366IHA6_9MICO|nr:MULTISPECIES: bifunctional NAD(P)/FAD-dependent oxidoreductase/class I SAM-dependent methyltransferase [Brevibacterium]RBP64933.1 thioredoxin reductase [Brevibacterium sanguinis]RBP71196.1 thioredoxin reductase [Brevibacterium celere]
MDTELANAQWDVIVVGGGSAGLSAALTLGRSLRRVLVVDSGRPRNRFAAHMHSVLGNEGTDPAALIAQGRREAEAYGVRFLDAEVTAASADEATVAVTTGQGQLHARALIVATGLTDELPDIPGLTDHWGTNVLHCPYCHGWEVRGQRIGVLGSSPMSLHQAQLVRQWTDRLIFFIAGCPELGPELTARLHARGVDLIDTPVAEVLADGDRLTGVRLEDDRTVEIDAIFTAPRARPQDGFLSHLGLDRAENPAGSFIAVDAMGRTSHPRIWAIGNVVNPMANVPIAMGAGALTGGAVNMALVNEDFDEAVASGSEEGRSAAGDRGSATGHVHTAGEAGSAAQHWEERYSESDRIWSGRVNAAVADVVSSLPLGAALELGCGEGGDAVWLAEQGWTVDAVDISATAVRRGAEGAADRGVADRISWHCADLGDWAPDRAFDLVTASFLHSEAELPRTEILRRAAGWVKPGGHLLIVSHVFESEEDIPPWARNGDFAHDHAHDLRKTPAEEVAELGLDRSEWTAEVQEIRRREATGPGGQQTAVVKDGVSLLRRSS